MPTFCIGKFNSPDGPWRNNFFDDQLTHFALLGQFNSFGSGIVKQATDLATVVGVNNPGENIQAFFRR